MNSLWNAIPYIPVIDPQYLPQLKSYKASGDDSSIVRKYITNPFYEFLMKFVPGSIAPNLITLIGFIMVMMSYFISSYYADYHNPTLPNWVFLVCCFCMFWYQTLDNLDGKQARKTGTSSPLGELFDHGCDALSCTFGGVPWLLTCAAGSNTMFIWLIALSNMICATWEEYFMGGMYLGIINGPNEGLLLIMANNIVGYIIGHAGYQASILETLKLVGLGDSPLVSLLPTIFLQQPFHFAINCLALLAAVYPVALNFYNVYHKTQRKDSKYSFGKALLALLPFVIILGTSAVWMKTTSIFQQHPHIMVYTIGVSFAYFNTQLTLSYILKSPLKLFDFNLLPYLAVLIKLTVYPSLPLSHTQLLYITCAVASIFYLNFAISMIKQIASYLNIGVLTIKVKKGQ